MVNASGNCYFYLYFVSVKQKNSTSPNPEVSTSTPSSNDETVSTAHLTHLPVTEKEKRSLMKQKLLLLKDYHLTALV